ncbi:hypothetical protein [Undibacterium curvum]|uniref:hypothetical protein n=1 Tax=Undibacterium curvum TaxID=2762294 RepID=UPI003D09AEC0
MKVIYPSRNFLFKTKNALFDQEILEIHINKGWRAKKLSNEITLWAATSSGKRLDGSDGTPPSITCMFFMMRLMTLHFLAFSADYEMHSVVNNGCVIIKYIPKNI